MTVWLFYVFVLACNPCTPGVPYPIVTQEAYGPHLYQEHCELERGWWGHENGWLERHGIIVGPCKREKR